MRSYGCLSLLVGFLSAVGCASRAIVTSSPALSGNPFATVTAALRTASIGTPSTCLRHFTDLERRNAPAGRRTCQFEVVAQVQRGNRERATRRVPSALYADPNGNPVVTRKQR